MQDLEELRRELSLHEDRQDTMLTGDYIQLAIAERLDGILTEMKEARLQQQGARNEAPGHSQNLYGPA